MYEDMHSLTECLACVLYFPGTIAGSYVQTVSFTKRSVYFVQCAFSAYCVIVSLSCSTGQYDPQGRS